MQVTQKSLTQQLSKIKKTINVMGSKKSQDIIKFKRQMKKLLYSCIAFCTLIFASCADKDVSETNATNNDGPGVKVSMAMEGEMQSDAVVHPTSRAIGYEVKDDNGFPTAKGLYDGVGASAHELATGTKVPVVLIFKSDNASQPVTKVKTMWTYTEGGKLTLKSSETFEMKSGTDLSQGTWYVCGILGGELDNNTVKFDGFVGDYTPTTSGSKTTFGAEIPYIFGWRKLETNQAKKTIKANDPVRFKQFGSIVRLKVTNNTGFGFKYDGVRIITSNILVGQFDLSAFDNASNLGDTQDGVLNDATSNDYKKVFEAFKFTQRAITDAKITSLASTNKFSIHNDLSYYDYKFNDFVSLANGGSDKGYVYVWMAPKQQTVKIYNTEEGVGSPVETKQISKTQFMLMAIPTETSAGNKIVPTSINMIPAYGTRADYVSGRNYPAKGSVVYNFPPLSYIAKHDNFGTDAELSVDNDYNVANTKRYTYQEYVANTEKITDKLASIPSGYMFAGNEYWRSIIAQYFGFAGFRNAGASYKFAVGVVSPAKLPGWSTTKLVFHSYSKGVKDSNGKLIAYMIGMSKKPDYITNSGEGQLYMGHVTASPTRISAGLDGNPTWIDNNNYRYTIRYEDVNGSAVLTQRYLGPRFVLDMDDIDTEDFWADPSNGTTYPADTKRIFPYAGVNSSVRANGQTIWFYDTNTAGKMTQYWTPDNTTTNGIYTPKGSTGTGAMLGLHGVLPKQAVAFIGSQGGDETCGFFQHYLYVNVPVNGDRDNADSRYKKNFIMSAPVRLWKTTPYAD